MAKFFPRNPAFNANNIQLPSNTQSRVWYGYRSSFFVIDGSLYHSANNTAVLYGWQTGNTGWDFANSSVATIDVDGVFEPSLFVNPYDLTGSQLSPEYNLGRQYVQGTFFSQPNLTWSFKNRSTGPVSDITISTSNSIITAATSRVSGVGYTPPANTANSRPTIDASFEAISTNYQEGYLPISNTSVLFITHSVGHFAWSSTTTGVRAAGNTQSTFTERRLGDTTHNFRQGEISVDTGAAIGNTAVMMGAFSDSPTSSLTTVGLPFSSYMVSWPGGRGGAFPVFAGPEGLFICDQQMFGTNTPGNFNPVNRGTPRSVFNAGTRPITSAPGAGEVGARVLAFDGDPHLFYYFYNADNGGLQGVDTSASTGVRLQLKSFNKSANTYTTLASIKKGVSGVIVPSQPISSDGTEHSFYNIIFNGTDVQTLTVQRVNLNGGSGAYAATPYTLNMTSQEQADLYADLGHANNFTSQFDQPGFRRQTVQRVWYSVSGTNARRLHLGIYNTDGYGVVTGANSFDDPSNRGRMFKIYSWLLDDNTPSATYLGSASTAGCGPRYFYPLDNNWNVLYLGGVLSNDQIFALNDTTGLYAYQSTMDYKAARLFKDKEGRQAVQVIDMANTSGGMVSNYMDILTAEIGQQLVISSNNTSFVYTGTTINSNVSVDVYNYLGERLSKNVALTIVGPTSTPGVTFGDNSYATTITTSDSESTNVSIKVISSIGAKILGTIVESA
jgi:hypothetical protein